MNLVRVRRIVCGLLLALMVITGAPVDAIAGTGARADAMAGASAGAEQEPPPNESAAELINALLGGLLGFRDMSGPELQREVAEVGGVAFRADVPLDYMSRKEMTVYFRELMDAEYPEDRARVDQRTLVALDLLAADADLRALRARLLEDNVVGFYDERPGRKRLYAVSDERRLTPANQLVLSHELRHALQDQYVDIYGMFPASVGDFDDRRLAYLSLLEGDATLVMERFLLSRIPAMADSGQDLSGLSLPAPDVPGVPPVLKDQLILPYIAGRDFARAVVKAHGLQGLKDAWTRPPQSTEQILHPAKYLSPEPPRPVDVSWVPAQGRLLNEGVLGEILTRTLLGEESAASASEGWGGDRYRVWDRSGRTLLVWRSVWDSPEDAQEFLRAAVARFGRRHAAQGHRDGFALFGSRGWSYALGAHAGGVVLVSSDDPGALDPALKGIGARRP